MVYAYIQDVPIGEDLYRRIIEKLGPEPVAGSLAHLCVRKPDGALQYIDVWESQEACEKAFDERIHTAVDTAFGGHPGQHRTHRPPARRPACHPRRPGRGVVMIRNTPTATGPAAATTSAHGAQVLPVPPPLFYGLAFAVGMVLHAMIVPLPMGAGLSRVVPGLILVGTGFALADPRSPAFAAGTPRSSRTGRSRRCSPTGPTGSAVTPCTPA